MCIGRQCLHKPAFCPFHFPVHATLGDISRWHHVVHHDNSSKGNFGHFLERAIWAQDYKIFTGTFYVIFLKWYFTMFPSSHRHLTAKRRNVTSMTSLDIFALLSLFISLVFWGQVAHEHFGNTTWMGHEIALLARGGRHFLVLTTEGSTPPHPMNDLCNDKNWKLFVTS